MYKLHGSMTIGSTILDGDMLVYSRLRVIIHNSSFSAAG